MATVTFDLDGVLQRNPFDSRHPRGVLGRIKNALAPYTGTEDAEDAAARALGLIIDMHKARLANGQYVEAYDWDDIVRVVAADLGYPDRFDVVAMVHEGCETPGLIYSYPGSAECLKALGEAGHTVLSITNGFRCYQEPVLSKLGLLEYFREVITPEVARAAKPQPAIFKAAEERYGGPCIHVGDTLLQDVAGARQAGFASIYIVQEGAPGWSELPADLAALKPWERPGAGRDWLQWRLFKDRQWDGTPPVALEACTPDAIVTRLDEVPETVAWLSKQSA